MDGSNDEVAVPFDANINIKDEIYLNGSRFTVKNIYSNPTIKVCGFLEEFSIDLLTGNKKYEISFSFYYGESYTIETDYLENSGEYLGTYFLNNPAIKDPLDTTNNHPGLRGSLESSIYTVEADKIIISFDHLDFLTGTKKTYTKSDYDNAKNSISTAISSASRILNEDNGNPLAIITIKTNNLKLLKLDRSVSNVSKNNIIYKLSNEEENGMLSINGNLTTAGYIESSNIITNTLNNKENISNNLVVNSNSNINGITINDKNHDVAKKLFLNDYQQTYYQIEHDGKGDDNYIIENKIPSIMKDSTIYKLIYMDSDTYYKVSNISDYSVPIVTDDYNQFTYFNESTEIKLILRNGNALFDNGKIESSLSMLFSITLNEKTVTITLNDENSKNYFYKDGSVYKKTKLLQTITLSINNSSKTFTIKGLFPQINHIVTGKKIGSRENLIIEYDNLYSPYKCAYFDYKEFTDLDSENGNTFYIPDRQYNIFKINNVSSESVYTIDNSGNVIVKGNTNLEKNTNIGTSEKIADLRIYGEIYSSGSHTIQGLSDYAEYFEWEDSNFNNEDRVGYFVSITSDRKIQIANAGSHILGIVSATPAIIGNGAELEWNKKYITDEWGRPVYETIVIPAKYDENGKKIESEHTEKRLKLNPDYDENIKYIPRSERPEWTVVGMLGMLRVRDDGSCKVGGYCKVNENGIATASESGYYVTKRFTDNIIEVFFK